MVGQKRPIGAERLIMGTLCSLPVLTILRRCNTVSVSVASKTESEPYLSPRPCATITVDVCRLMAGTMMAALLDIVAMDQQCLDVCNHGSHAKRKEGRRQSGNLPPHVTPTFILAKTLGEARERASRRTAIVHHHTNHPLRSHDSSDTLKMAATVSIAQI